MSYVHKKLYQSTQTTLPSCTTTFCLNLQHMGILLGNTPHTQHKSTRHLYMTTQSYSFVPILPPCILFKYSIVWVSSILYMPFSYHYYFPLQQWNNSLVPVIFLIPNFLSIYFCFVLFCFVLFCVLFTAFSRPSRTVLLLSFPSSRRAVTQAGFVPSAAIDPFLSSCSPANTIISVAPAGMWRFFAVYMLIFAICGYN